MTINEPVPLLPTVSLKQFEVPVDLLTSTLSEEELEQWKKQVESRVPDDDKS